jgi:hypothetical protein
MSRISIFGLTAIATNGVALLPVGAVGPEKSLKERLVGIWLQVSIDGMFPDGIKRQLFGPTKWYTDLHKRRARHLILNPAVLCDNALQPYQAFTSLLERRIGGRDDLACSGVVDCGSHDVGLRDRKKRC